MSSEIQVVPNLEKTKENLNNLPDGTWWHFSQNNSGGYWTKPGMNVYVLAASEDEAWDKLMDEPGYSGEYCECCGNRWYSPARMDKAGVVEDILTDLQSQWSRTRWHDPKKDVPVFAFVI